MNYRITVVIFSFVLSAQLTFSQSAEDEIAAVLHAQAEAWSAGDIDKFMEGYIPNETLHFLGAKGLTSGWQATLDRYKKSYPSTEAMGKLTFDLQEITKRTKKVYTVIGKFHLERETMDELSGYFLLVAQKIKGEWKIVADSTH